jgi:hypothetical protein
MTDKQRHPPLRRFMWHPLVAVLPVLHFGYRLLSGQGTAYRVVGLAVGVIWIVGAVYDRWTEHRLLDYLYAQDDGDDA